MSSTAGGERAGAAPVEEEVKFFVTDLGQFRQGLLTAGGKPIKPRVFEQNVRLDTEDEGLRAHDKLLRLRQDSHAILTYKGPPAARAASEVRVLEELEVTVSDFDTAFALLGRLGFQPRQRYEKYRETFQLGAVTVVLDELPFGDFVEIEGPAAAIKEAAFSLGFRWTDRILANYLALMDQVVAHYDLPFTDLTFTNFAGRPAAVAAVLPRTGRR